MQCQICQKNEATIHLTEITGGLRKEMHICEVCAIEQGITVKSQMPVNELLSNLLAAQPCEEELLGSTDKEVCCPNCGFTIEQFRKEAVLGCPNDYEVFEEVLLPLIEKAHAGQTAHCGKVPSGIPADTRKEAELSKLRQCLQTAIQKEDYEQAAELRDKIAEQEQLKTDN